MRPVRLAVFEDLGSLYTDEEGSSDMMCLNRLIFWSFGRMGTFPYPYRN